jgi:hypothetical protein
MLRKAAAPAAGPDEKVTAETEVPAATETPAAPPETAPEIPAGPGAETAPAVSDPEDGPDRTHRPLDDSDLVDEPDQGRPAPDEGQIEDGDLAPIPDDVAAAITSQVGSYGGGTVYVPLRFADAQTLQMFLEQCYRLGWWAAGIVFGAPQITSRMDAPESEPEDPALKQGRYRVLHSKVGDRLRGEELEMKPGIEIARLLRLGAIEPMEDESQIREAPANFGAIEG